MSYSFKILIFFAILLALNDGLAMVLTGESGKQRDPREAVFVENSLYVCNSIY